ncbi:MAG: hypothetical protein CME67_03010 [Halobacteriovoraceae bacterium]|nr:hypothetical protein [Peredibacter sp.]MBJ00176.1 hypothetical protein [Halobacteriovoraceae bacterium]|tara:strand:- start:3459 stop:3707 length:249 start_codon:yes stop_codon:yes gene_type:complete
MANKEVFLESLRSQYRSDIEMIIKECQHFGRTWLDIEALNSKLGQLHDFASMAGLSEDEWLELIYELSPEVYENLDFGVIAA